MKGKIAVLEDLKGKNLSLSNCNSYDFYTFPESTLKSVASKEVIRLKGKIGVMTEELNKMLK